MISRIITTDACIAEGTRELVRLDPRFLPVIEQTGPLPLRLKPQGFAALMGAIVSQQISVAAAASIWQRLKDAGLTDKHTVVSASEDDLRKCGLSRPKIRYVTAIASSDVDFDQLAKMPDRDVVAELVKLPGIGAWTAEIYAMFSLGRADVFAPGDLALQEAARLLFELDRRPNEKELRTMASDWSPWRSVAARALFAYYRVVKSRDGIR